MKAKLKKLGRYEGKIKITSGEAIFANEAIIARKFMDAGFIDVKVTKQTATEYTAKGTWPKESLEVELPNKVVSVKEI